MREVMLISHFIGLAMGVGTSLAMMFIGIASSKMEAAEAEKFTLKAMSLGTMGHIGLTILIVSGGYLMTPFWKILPSNPMLIAKLTLVLVLGALIGIISSYAKKAKAGVTAVYLRKIKNLGTFSLLTGIAIIILAVLVFR
jgi:uncharacterized membrane protein